MAKPVGHTWLDYWNTFFLLTCPDWPCCRLLFNRYRKVCPGRKIGQEVKLVKHPHLLPSLRMSGVMPPNSIRLYDIQKDKVSPILRYPAIRGRHEFRYIVQFFKKAICSFHEILEKSVTCSQIVLLRGKLSLCTPRRHTRKVEVQLHLFLSSALVTDQ